MNEDFIKKYGALLIIVLILILYSFNCRINKLNYAIEELQEKIESIEEDREQFLDSYCFKNLSSYCVEYKADKKLIEDIFTNS